MEGGGGVRWGSKWRRGGGGGQGSIRGKHSGWITRLRRLPLFHSLAQNFVGDLNFQEALGHIEADHVAIAYRGDGAAQRGFGRDVACHESARPAAEAAIA